MINLTDVIAVWDELHVRDVGDIGFCDLEKALDRIVGVHNDVNSAIFSGRKEKT